MIHTQRSLTANYSSLHVGNSVFKVTKDGSEVVDELATSIEEADTRTLLCTKHASSNYLYMVIVAEDTDVFNICLSVFHQISDMYIRCVTKTDYTTLTYAKLGSLLVKRLVKLYKDFMHSPAATPSAHKVVGENQCSKAGYEGCRLKKAIVGVGKAVVLLLLTFCLLLLSLWESLVVLCFVVRYFLVLQSS